MELLDFKDKKITVMGIGLHGGGVGVIKFLHAAGAKILATDLRPETELKESMEALKNLSGVEYVLGQHREEDFINADMIIKNPAVPDDSKFLTIAKEHKIPIETDIGIFFELCPGTIIGVTGSRGKSTTASLIYEFLKIKYPDTILAGNIRTSVLEKLNEIRETTLVVLELSSWQLNGLAAHKKSPQIAVLTNIMADHLNRYKSMTDYIADKKIIFKFQKPKDFLILNYDDETLRSFATETESKVYYFSAANSETMINPENLPKAEQEPRIGAYLVNGKIFFGAAKEKIIEAAHIKLLGRHNIANILAAVTVARLYDVAASYLKKALKEFSGLEGRIQFIQEIKGVKYFNDTTATIPEATIAAIEALSENYSLKPENLILIAGGADKNLNFAELAKTIVQKTKGVVLLKGTATKKLEPEIKKLLLTEKLGMPIKKFDNMQKAVLFASKNAKKGDIILLSPGCASFGLFRHEFERGEKFNQAVAALASESLNKN